MKLARMTARRWLCLVSTGAIAAIFAAGASLKSPLILIPASPSLPSKPYVQTFGDAAIGEIITVPIPAAALRYYRLAKKTPPKELMKPVVAGEGDIVCNSLDGGLRINGRWLAPTASMDKERRPLPLWTDCGPLEAGKLFLFSDYAENSFDSRYFGPIDEAAISGVYRPLY